MKRLTDPVECRSVTDKYPDFFELFYAEEWLANDDNYALIEDRNIAFAEYKGPGTYWVHFCYDTARGREAVELTKRITNEFCSIRDVKVLIGLIELRNRPARWLIRQAGFKSLDVLDTKIGYCEMFYWTEGIK